MKQTLQLFFRWSLPTLMVVTLSGCATPPRIALVCTTAGPPTLAVALGCTSDLVKRLNGGLDVLDQNAKWARAGIQGGTLGSSVAAMYGGHRDLIVGFGLLGGSSYAIGNLYSPQVFESIYSAGLDAANCAEGFVTQAAGANASIDGAKAVVIATLSKLA